MNKVIKRTAWHCSQWLVLLSAVHGYTCPEKNVAVGKKAVQSSILSRGSLSTFPANLAIDGNRSTLSQTEPGYVQWWYVDLITPQNVARIHIIVCENCDSKFYMGNDYLLFTGVTRTSLNLVASKIQTKTSSFFIQLPTAPLVRFVEIQRYERSNAKYPLALAEVEVYREPITPEQSSLLPFKPSFTSSWLNIESPSEMSQITIKHDLHAWPIRVTTEVQVNRSNNAIVFNGNGLAQGALEMIYNSTDVHIVQSVHNMSTWFTGPKTAWTGPEIEQANRHFQVRVKVWRRTDLPNPRFRSQWTRIYDMKNFIEMNHTVQGYPDLVVIQLNFSIADQVYFFEGRGSSNVMDLMDSTGNVLFGFNSKTVRVWISNEFKQAFRHLADSLGESESLTAGNASWYIRVTMWKFFPDPLFDIRVSPETTDFSKPQELPYDITTDDYILSVEIEVVEEGNNTGYRFYGTGSSINGNVTGGLMYALTSTSILIWRPTTGYFVHIGEWWETEHYSQTTNNVSIRLAFYRLYNEGDVMCNLNQDSFPYYGGKDRVSMFKEEISTTCPTGMTLESGDLKRACARRCSWNGFPAVCKNVTCPIDSLQVANANYSVSGNSMQDTAEYQCDTGYAYTGGNLTRVCLHTGQWSGQEPVCEEIVCPLEETHVPSSSYNITGIKLFDTVVYNCDFGYNHTSGDLYRSCLQDSQWSGEAPVCSVIPCPKDLVITNNSRYTIEGVLPGNKVTFHCDKGYRLTSGDNVKICQLGGQWEGPDPTCTEILCNQEDLTVPHAVHILKGQRPGDNLTYSCRTGYYHTRGNLTRVCQEDGSWTGESPTCDEILCSDTNLDIPYATYVTTGQKPGDNITYICTPGYQHGVGDLTRICQENGSWSGEKPICNVTVSCTNNVTVENADYFIEGYSPGQNISYICNDGFQYSYGNLTRVCQQDGTWSGSSPKCEEVVCSFVGNDVPNATYTSTGYRINDISVYACDDGFRHISGNLTRTCQTNGLWSGALPECIEVTCSSDGLTVPNTTHSVTGYKPGDTVLYQCDLGFSSSSKKFSRTCQKNGTWNGDVPVCQEIECTVNNVDAANTKHTVQGSKPGQNIEYVCDEGFVKTAGNLTKMCQIDGSWSGYVPECKAVTCPVEKLNASRSVYKLHGNRYGDNVTYTCDYGYRHIKGSKYRWCLANGSWSGELPTCSLIECPIMEVNTSAHVFNVTGNRYMDKAIFRCPSDLRVGQGSITRICQSDSTWSGSRLVCKPCFCPCVHETEEEVAQQMKKTAKQLTIKKSTLSRTLRKKTSARDERQSAKAIGYIGVLMLVLILAVLVVPDLPSLHRDITRGLDNLKLIFNATVVPVLCTSDKGNGYELDRTLKARKQSAIPEEHERDGIKGPSFDQYEN